jgi:hypothetical protein
LQWLSVDSALLYLFAIFRFLFRTGVAFLLSPTTCCAMTSDAKIMTNSGQTINLDLTIPHLRNTLMLRVERCLQRVSYQFLPCCNLFNPAKEATATRSYGSETGVLLFFCPKNLFFLRLIKGRKSAETYRVLSNATPLLNSIVVGSQLPIPHLPAFDIYRKTLRTCH